MTRLHLMAKHAYYSDAISVEILKSEQRRIDTETATLEAEMSEETYRLRQAKDVIRMTLTLAQDCHANYVASSPANRRLWNQAFFDEVRVKDGRITRHKVGEPAWFEQANSGGENRTISKPHSGSQQSPARRMTDAFGAESM